MKKEAQELGFDPWGDSAQEEFERRVTDLEQHVLENPEDDLEIMRGFNSEVRQMNNPLRIPDLVFSFPGIFSDSF